MLGRRKQRSRIRLETKPSIKTAKWGWVRRPGFWAKVFALVLFGGSVWLLYAFFTDSRFTVKQVEVQGNSLIQEKDILQAMGIVRESIFRVRPQEEAELLKKTFGCLRRVSVRCWLPDHVLVSVEERQALLLWESGGRYWWVDAEGNVLGEAASRGGLPVIHDVGNVDPLPKEFIPGVPWQLVRELVKALPEVTSLDYTRAEGLILYVTEDRWPVFLGYRGSGKAKARVLRALVSDLQRRGIQVEYIDLRDEWHPTFKERRM
ncbi:MAG: FtsQ-type POTRA domain-containing protein [Anaerolineae bacterium]|nr:FtsQ-type POTRA domain-containing protein [Anaerolineae bacterium]